MDDLTTLRERLGEIADLSRAAGVLAITAGGQRSRGDKGLGAFDSPDQPSRHRSTSLGQRAATYSLKSLSPLTPYPLL